MGYNKNNSKGMPKHMSQDHKMAYDRSEISRLKKDIHYHDLEKKGMSMEGPLHGNAFGHAMQKAGGDYDKAKAMLENKGPAKHGEMHDGPMKMGGSFMSKHAGNSYFHKQNLLNDMPIDDHAGGPLAQNKDIYKKGIKDIKDSNSANQQKQSMFVESSPEEIARLQEEAKKNKMLKAAIEGGKTAATKK